MIRTAIIGMLVGPGLVGFFAGYSPRALAVIIIVSAVGAFMWALLFGMLKVAGQADDQAGIPRG